MTETILFSDVIIHNCEVYSAIGHDQVYRKLSKSCKLNQSEPSSSIPSGIKSCRLSDILPVILLHVGLIKYRCHYRKT